MKDWCVVTGASGTHTQLLAMTEPTMRLYAGVMDMDFAAAELVDRDLPPSWQKISVMSGKLEDGYKGVLWVDADAAFVRFDEDIRDLARPGWNWVHNRYDMAATAAPWPCVPCAGVVAVTPEAQGTLATLWEMRTEYAHAPWWEQSAALKLFGWDERTGELHAPEGQHELPARWDWTPASPCEDRVILHASGMPFEQRVALLRDVLREP